VELIVISRVKLC